MARSSSRAAEPPVVSPPAEPLYEGDVYSWAFRQAQLLREGRFDEADIPNILEEIESLGRSEKSALRSSAARVIQHMLKWDYQPERRPRSWQTSIATHRVHVEQSLAANPGLKSQLPKVLAEAYRLGVALAVDETELERSAFPVRCPYDWDTSRNEDECCAGGNLTVRWRVCYSANLNGSAATSAGTRTSGIT